jgi:hypothetical protein
VTTYQGGRDFDRFPRNGKRFPAPFSSSGNSTGMFQIDFPPVDGYSASRTELKHANRLTIDGLVVVAPPDSWRLANEDE